jgi:hypothetical protein
VNTDMPGNLRRNRNAEFAAHCAAQSLRTERFTSGARAWPIDLTSPGLADKDVGYANENDMKGQKPALAAYSITSSARAEIIGGTSMPSAFAVFKLMTNSNLVVWTTGKSVTLAPLRIFPAYTPDCRNASERLVP